MREENAVHTQKTIHRSETPTITIQQAIGRNSSKACDQWRIVGFVLSLLHQGEIAR